MAETNLRIIAYGKPKDGDPSKEIGDFTVDFNPNTFTVNNKIEYKQPDAKGQTGGDPVFEKIPPLEFSLEFTIDGTGVAMGNLSPDKKNNFKNKKHDYVKSQIIKLREVTGSGINGDIHRPNYLALLWGTFRLECVITALNITYNLFDAEGTPLRAKVTCNFLERIAPGKGGRQSRLESPDLTKYQVVRECDILPLIARNNYEDSAYYLQLARVNKLKNFRNIPPGVTLILPPMVEQDA
ncbi:LysM peptidoglycan-binding domain-containing protein [Adhaeribacter swui]|uniref:LysM peptidoglycan-binding domain-containing protein n=1 Tax=Adhaeribacter swui TaxID=2086471 RepID=A0A7G7GC27_9BACT|nr:LysM peptidoglycan-binding domain-containing protein [Adhaeribacter swui]QNF34711.1 LysM peptidoglycan-binding domain-containing protein [Adhaeribacter swui]